MDAKAALSQLACPLIPVVVIDTLDDAVPVAEALLWGGISALEITLRTPVACPHASLKMTHSTSFVDAPSETISTNCGNACQNVSFFAPI